MTEPAEQKDPSVTADDTSDSSGEAKQERATVYFWKQQLQAAKRLGDASMKAGEEAYREYRSDYDNDPKVSGTAAAKMDGNTTRIPIYWSSVRTIQPALYSRTPIVVAQPMLDTIEDDLADLCCDGLERLSKYLIHGFSFDRVQYATRDDFIHAAKATERVIYEANISSNEDKIQVFPQFSQPQDQAPPPVPNQPGSGPNILESSAQASAIPPQLTGWLDDLGDPVEFEGEPEQDEDGNFFITQTTETLDYECFELLPVSFKDIRHTPYARHWEEITWISFRSSLTKDQVANRFGAELAAKVSYSDKHGDNDDRTKTDDYLPEKFIDVWEIWDKEEKKVRWLVESYAEFLDEKDDPYELPGFYPCAPFILGTIGPDNLYPTPDFIQLKSYIYQLHGLAARFRSLVRANKVRGVYDASVTELADLAGATPIDGDFLGINNFQGQIIGKGGLEGVVQFFPTQELTQAIQTIQEVIQAFKDEFNELYGIPDIVRGNTDPNETAAAQQEKGKWLSLRFSSVQREFQRLIRDSIEMLIDLALRKMDEKKIHDIMGFNMKSPEEQQMFPQVMALLKDFENRKIRIDIETDSTISFNEDADVAQRQQLASTLMEGFTQIQQAANGNNDLMLIGMNTLMFVVRGMRNGKMIADEMQQYINKLKNPPPAPPPPPSPEEIKAQAQVQAIQQKGQVQLQVAQQKAQTDMQTDNQKAQAELQIAEQKAEMEMQIERDKAQQQQQLEGVQAQHDVLVDHLRMQIEQLKAQLQARLDAMKMQGDMQLEAQKTKSEIVAHQIEARKPEAAQAPQTVILGGTGHTL